MNLYTIIFIIKFKFIRCSINLLNKTKVQVSIIIEYYVCVNLFDYVDVFGGARGEQMFSRVPNLSTNDIKQIVDSLNRPPFMSNLSLVEFDDKAPLELLELLN